VFCVFCGSIFLAYCRHDISNLLTPAAPAGEAPNLTAIGWLPKVPIAIKSGDADAARDPLI
jgi:hypothetical protein